ncbi:TIGR02186 family protein [Temperatibacter marinus]|uniref:TIGR02186 family protein n=1 Tax=Temperatibacter marinus TaxID=1456591 RepID=A0AA52EK41_9PROT|nr:TIGR02186 family protein [Temperatibacter marinus]WND03949.1 TIGR02186 family protein [Temperatibacter marinus]
MMKRLFLAFFLLVPLGMSAQAQVTDLSENRIEIRYSFEGADLILFGTPGQRLQPGEYDVVVVVRGPTVPTIVRKKAHKYGIWMNDQSLTFPQVPGYYAVAANRPLAEIASKEDLEKHAIGFENMALETEQPSLSAVQLKSFKEALYRGRQEADLYRQGQDTVKLIGEGLFRTNVHLPANVPVGDFLVNAYIFQDKNLLAFNEIPMVVAKEGFERAVYEFAHTMPMLYGLTAVFIALVAGWLAGMAGLRKG